MAAMTNAVTRAIQRTTELAAMGPRLSAKDRQPEHLAPAGEFSVPAVTSTSNDRHTRRPRALCALHSLGCDIRAPALHRDQKLALVRGNNGEDAN